MVDFLQNHVYKLIVIDDYRRRYYRDSIIIDWTPNVEIATDINGIPVTCIYWGCNILFCGMLLI